jgi:TfoX/Sxy family transcriptional regulator of competence genes
MASDPDFMEFVSEQIRNAGDVSARKMFGEYAVYCGGKVVALVCDNRFFVKPTDRGRAFIGDPVEAPPYPGARNYFLVEDRIDDRDWMSELVRITAADLPEPKKTKASPRPAGKKTPRPKRKKAPARRPAKRPAAKPAPSARPKGRRKA